MDLAGALTPADTPGVAVSATIAGVNADGTVMIDLGGGRLVSDTTVGSWYTPQIGDVVEVIRRDTASFFVLGTTRDSNATTQPLLYRISIPYNVRPVVVPNVGPGTNPYVVNAQRTGSWRSIDGWGKDSPYQGAYGTSNFYRGAYFYGSAFGVLAGRRCTGITIRLHRNTGIGGSGVGSGGAVPQMIAGHIHATQPGGQPNFTTGVVNVGSLTAPNDTQVGTFPLPVSWGQALINGSLKGFGHLSLTNAYYERCKSVAEDSTTGQLSIAWE